MSYISITGIPIRNDAGSYSLLNLAGDGTTLNTAVINEALTDADGIIDSYLLAGGYTVPLTAPYPGVIKSIERSIVVYKLFERGNGLNEAAVKYYDEAILNLEKIRDGKMIIPGLVKANRITVIQPFEDDDLGGYDEAKFNMSLPHGKA